MRDPNAMCLATVDEAGRPSTRMVLLKGLDERGLVFYTNLESRKGRDLLANRNVSLTFYWRELNRQVHVRGTATPVSAAEADTYFATRDHGSQLGAWASEQSRPLRRYTDLLAAVAKVKLRYLGRGVPRPPFWSGFRVEAREIEFWVAGVFRLHRRTLFTRQGETWATSRLFP